MALVFLHYTASDYLFHISILPLIVTSVRRDIAVHLHAWHQTPTPSHVRRSFVPIATASCTDKPSGDAATTETKRVTNV